MDNWDEMKRLKTEAESMRRARKLKASKDRLQDVIKKRMKTCFIGAISSVEKHMDFLFSTEEGKELYETVRKEILDNGNDEIRRLEKDLEVYEIDFKQYRLELKMEKDNE
jgi:hypothetical protein